jgi:hypothetical protein
VEKAGRSVGPTHAAASYDSPMPRFLIVRRFSVDESQMDSVGRRSRELTEVDFPEIVWEHSHVVVNGEGTVFTYCVYDAPSEEVVYEHSKRLGRHNVEALHEIAGDVTPADFPPL